MSSKVFVVVFILATTLLLQSDAFHVGTGNLRLGKKRDSLPSRIQLPDECTPQYLCTICASVAPICRKPARGRSVETWKPSSEEK
ncbi:unnamed protein product [Porites evermanni]|uniref:Uncharacterized protein n=1 Tax=Porites evermanni TaxID=104178 RepID=A0ABN8ME46_9CNID|nr:unnamed protein product [Porites evermanni]